MIKIAICTVNWNGKKDTLDFLSSLKKLDTKGLEVQVFVTDGGSSDGSADAIKKQFPTTNLIEKKENRGSAGGYNDSAKAGLAWGADYILLINNDTEIKDKNLLLDLVKTIESEPNIGMVSPKLYFAPGFEYQKEKYKPSDKGNVIWYAGGSFDWKNINSHHRGIDDVDTGKYDLVEETEFVSSSCVLVSRKIYDKGIFWDEGLFAYYDDNDFQEKVKKAGFKLYYDGLTGIYHKVSRTGGIGSPFSDYMTTRNRLIFAMRYAPLRTKIAVLREAFRLLKTGRPMQKQGVKDFLLGIRGALGD